MATARGGDQDSGAAGQNDKLPKANPRVPWAAKSGSPVVQAGTKSPRNAARTAGWMRKDTGQCLKDFHSAQLEAGHTEVTSSTGFDLVCTYNWILQKECAIYVPGMLEVSQT
jgi:hypothetical protein